MSVAAAVSSGLQGALLLARGQPEGLRLVPHDTAAAAWSFWAIPLCLPAVVCLKLLTWLPAGLPAKAPLLLGRHLLLFVVAWLAFAWVSHALAGKLDRAARWPLLLATWSYCSVIENTGLALGGLPGALGAPAPIAQFCELATLGWALWLDWFAIRLALDVKGPVAGLVLAVDVALGIVTGMFAGS